MDAVESADGRVSVTLKDAEALVLFEWLQRVDDQEVEIGIIDQAVQRVLWDLSASLERVLVAPFSPDYEALLSSARAQVRDSTD